LTWHKLSLSSEKLILHPKRKHDQNESIQDISCIAMRRQNNGPRDQSRGISNEDSCLQMTVTHAFNGDCCTVQDTANGGCVLIVINGKCAVSIITSLTVADGLLRF
jgi:hypothetical protein